MSSATINHVGEQVYWVLVSICNTKTGERKKLHWADLPWAVRSKWGWYFKYRAALAQVQYPRWDVQFSWGSCEATGAQLARHRRNVVRAKKAKITEYENKMRRWKAEWTQLFPIEEQPFWAKAAAKIERTRLELAEAEKLAREAQSNA